MSEMGDMSDSWWFMEGDLDQARSGEKCQCGFDATYKDRRDAKDYLTQYHMHSWWCLKYKEKPKDDDGK